MGYFIFYFYKQKKNTNHLSNHETVTKELVRWLGKGAFCQAWPLELDSKSLLGERRELTPPSCPLTSKCVPWHVLSPQKNKLVNVKKKKKKSNTCCLYDRIIRENPLTYHLPLRLRLGKPSRLRICYVNQADLSLTEITLPPPLECLD